MKKVLMYITIFFGIGTIITVVGLTIADKFIYSLSQTEVVGTADTSTGEDENTSKIKIEDGVENIEYSYNNKYYTYLKDSKIYINKVEDGSNVATIEEDAPICFSKLLYDKNLIIYFTQDKTGNTSTLTLKTYEIDTERKSKYNKFNINNFSRIKDINMSPVINMIYINVETKSGKTTNNLIYKVNLFNTMSIVKSGYIFNEMIMLQYTDMVYYEDENSNIYYGSNKLNIFKGNVDMIGIDEEDQLYFLSKKNKDVVYVVKSNKIVKTIKLEDTDVINTYTNNYDVYLIYGSYVLDISSNNPLEKVAKLSNNVTFEAIKNGYMYTRTTDNLLIKTPLLVGNNN
jgi:hypothetical protein